MFPRKMFPLVVLSILKKHPEGLSGYSIIQEMKEIFKPYPFQIPSPGTIYPLLKRLTETGDLEVFPESGNPKTEQLSDNSDQKGRKKQTQIYKITEQGKEKLTKRIPETLEKSVNLLPLFSKFLINILPLSNRIDLAKEFTPHIFSCEGCSSDLNILDDAIFSENQTCTRLSTTMERLKTLEQQLIQAKTRIQERAKQEIQAIDEKLEILQEKYKKCQESKKSWTKIPIEDDDD